MFFFCPERAIKVVPSRAGAGRTGRLYRLYLRHQPRLPDQEGQLKVKVELPAPPHLHPGRGNKPKGALELWPCRAGASTDGQTWAPTDQNFAAWGRGRGLLEQAFAQRSLQKLLPPTGQEQLPKGPARSAQPPPNRPYRPLEKPHSGLAKTPLPQLNLQGSGRRVETASWRGGRPSFP